jgi:hypothetical protein
MTSNAVFNSGKVKVFFKLSPACMTKLKERMLVSGPGALDSMKMMLNLPNDGKLNLLTMSPGKISTELSRGQL